MRRQLVYHVHLVVIILAGLALFAVGLGTVAVSADPQPELGAKVVLVSTDTGERTPLTFDGMDWRTDEGERLNPYICHGNIWPLFTHSCTSRINECNGEGIYVASDSELNEPGSPEEHDIACEEWNW